MLWSFHDVVWVDLFPSSDLGFALAWSWLCLPDVSNGEVRLVDASNVVCCIFMIVVIPIPAVVIPVVVVPTLLHVVHIMSMSFFSFVVPIPSVVRCAELLVLAQEVVVLLLLRCAMPALCSPVLSGQACHICGMSCSCCFLFLLICCRFLGLCSLC